MLQQINLYRAPGKEKKEIFNVVVMIKICVLFMFSLIVLSGYLFYAQYKADLELTQLTQEREILDQGLDKVKNKVPREEDREKFLKEVEDLKKIKNSKEKMIVTLSNLQQDRNVGFSAYLEAMSQHYIPGLWLTKFSISAGGKKISLEGDVEDAEYVPQLINVLGKSEVFTNKTFEYLKVYIEDHLEKNNETEQILKSEKLDKRKDKEIMHFIIKSDI